MNTTSSLISVIVPVYNSEIFLKNCIESILNQTHINLELILIDDGSQDQSSYLCDLYSKIDSRIIVIHKENEGPGVARNCGLDIAKGEYISFIDSDDWVHPQFLEILLKEIQSGNYDIAMCDNIQNKRENLEFNFIDSKDIKPIPLSKEEFFNKTFQDWRYIVVWGKLIKRTIIQKKRFINQYYAEDLEFIISIALKSNKHIFLTNQLYFQIESSSSLTAKPLSRRYTDHLSGLLILYERLPHQYQTFRAKILETLFLDMQYLKHQSIQKHNKDFNQLYNRISRSLKKKFYFSPYIPFKNKRNFFILSVPGIYKIYLKIYLPLKIKKYLKY